MRGHEGAVSSISIHSSGRYAISTSSDTAQLWDLDTFQRKRKLNIRQSVGIQRVNTQMYQMKTTFTNSSLITLLVLCNLYFYSFHCCQSLLFVLQVFFLPLSNTILSCFSDDSIFAWESDTLVCKYQLPIPDCGPKISYKAFAVTRWVFHIITTN